jgi:hypothetical protein
MSCEEGAKMAIFLLLDEARDGWTESACRRLPGTRTPELLHLYHVKWDSQDNFIASSQSI